MDTTPPVALPVQPKADATIVECLPAPRQSILRAALANPHFNNERDGPTHKLSKRNVLVTIVPCGDVIEAICRRAGRDKRHVAANTRQALEEFVHVYVVCTISGKPVQELNSAYDLQDVPPPSIVKINHAEWLPAAAHWAATGTVPATVPTIQLQCSREFPLSSSHGNRVFKFVVVLGPADAIMETLVHPTAFEVRAKRPPPQKVVKRTSRSAVCTATTAPALKDAVQQAVVEGRECEPQFKRQRRTVTNGAAHASPRGNDDDKAGADDGAGTGGGAGASGAGGSTPRTGAGAGAGASGGTLASGAVPLTSAARAAPSSAAADEPPAGPRGNTSRAAVPGGVSTTAMSPAVGSSLGGIPGLEHLFAPGGTDAPGGHALASPSSAGPPLVGVSTPDDAFDMNALDFSGLASPAVPA